MSPRPKELVPLKDLFGLAASQLEQSIIKPNILAFGQKSYPEQERFHRSDKKGRFVAGGNRGGKTDAIVVDSIWWATNTHPYLKRPANWGSGPLQLRFVVVDITKGVEQIMLPKFKRWMTTSMLIDGEWDRSWDSKNLILTFSNGSSIDFVTHGMELSKLGGVPRHIVYFDEEPPQNIFNESMMRLLDYEGRWVIAATPVKGMGWSYDLLWEPAESNYASAEPDLNWPVDIFVLTAEQNPYIETAVENFGFYMMGMDKEEREMREHGAFVARSGLVFPNFKLQTHVVEPFIPPKSWDWYSSADFGINNPTAWLWHAVSPEGEIVTFAEHYQSDMTVGEHANVVHEREKAWGKIPEIRVGDPAGAQRSAITGTSILTEYALREIYILTEGIPHEVMIGIEKQQQYFRLEPRNRWGQNRPRWVITSNCVNYIRELKKLRWATYTSERTAYDLNRQEKVHKKDDHAFDSGRYFATLMPDLTPLVDHDSDGVPITISYQDLLARMSADETVEFVDNRESSQTEWETTESFGDLYEGIM